MSDPNQQLLQQVGEVQGQLKLITQMIQQNHESTHQRINDFRHAIEGRITGVEVRIDGVDARIVVLEKNERGTALKVAGIGTVAGAIAAASVELINYLGQR